MTGKKENMKVIFEKPFDFHPKNEHRSIIAYQPSKKPQTVTRECGERAIKGGYAIKHEEKSNESGKTKKKTAD